jgi:hypothetical protein
VPDPGRRFTFQPLERRGVLLGLDGGQIGTLLGGILAALAAGRSVGSPAGPGVAAVILGASVVGALWPLFGRPLAGWIPVIVGWALRAIRGPLVDGEPLTGRRSSTAVPPSGVSVTSDPDSASSRPGSGVRRIPHGADRRVPAPAGVALLHVKDGSDTGLGVVRDRRSGLLAAVVPVQGQSYALLDVDEQLRRLEAWRAALAILARPGTPIRRIQWVHRSAAVLGTALVAAAEALPPGRSSCLLAQESYRQLVTDLAPATQCHRAWVILAVGGALGPSGSSSRAMESLQRELRLLAGHLRNGNLAADSPLGRDALRALLGSAHDRDIADGGDGSRRRPWSMASNEEWAAVRTDGTWHTTYWIAEWPRVEVNPDFLTPLLLCDGRRTVSVVMAPVPPDRAAREARAARAADVADEELRSRAGFLPSARRGRESEGVVRRETELADGHAEYRFSGYVTVTAPDRGALTIACAETEQAAQRAHLDLRLLYGRQAEAFLWTLPLARGLA